MQSAFALKPQDYGKYGNIINHTLRSERNPHQMELVGGGNDASDDVDVRHFRARELESAMAHMTTIAIAAVAIVLVLGLANMARGTNANLSQRLMRWRVGLQFTAIVIIMVVLLLRG